MITGDSLGGALTILCGLNVVKNSTVRVIPELHTFAGPRTGDPKFAGNFNAAVPICNRVVNFWTSCRRFRCRLFTSTWARNCWSMVDSGRWILAMRII